MPARVDAVDVAAAFHDPKRANILYHDYEASTYDAKWSISFDDRCTRYARDRFIAAAGERVAAYPRAVEVGAGTGFFLLNLARAGIVERGVLTDISPGMVAQALHHATELGLAVTGLVGDAEAIPLADASADLVVGHAVLHHLPDVETGLREVLRVLRPGGRFVFAGEPSRIGDRYARRLGRITWAVTTRVTRWPALAPRWARPLEELDASSQAAALEAVVDVHTFDPDQLARAALRAGAVDVRASTEELTAALVGWPVRTFEAAVNPERLGWGWATAAYRTWQRLMVLDAALARVVPAAWYYNVALTGLRPE
ncbi:MAG: class I SAM-dependent methyltransferase [Actinomycetes bacterium]